MPIQSSQLLLDHWHDNAPKFGRLLQLVVVDELEAVHNLLRRHLLIAKLLVNIDDVVRVLAVEEHHVDLGEDHVNIVIKVVVAASMD